MAAQWYRKAAEQGFADAQYNLGWMYQNGRGVAQDDAEAARWYRKAAEQGFADAQNMLGWMYQNGQGVARDDAEAVKWYRKAAEQGLADAQNMLGWMYQNGRGVAQDDAVAWLYYYKAAGQGLAVAQNNLGSMYQNGQGVARDDAEAVKWYRKAAEQNNAVAQVNLADSYLRGVSKDYQTAARWYAAAAAQGEPRAQLSLGYLYGNGHGVPRDEHKADQLFEQAERNGTGEVASEARNARRRLAESGEPGDALAALLGLGAALILFGALASGDQSPSGDVPSDGEWKAKFWCEVEYVYPFGGGAPEEQTWCKNRSGGVWRRDGLGDPCRGKEGWCDVGQ